LEWIGNGFGLRGDEWLAVCNGYDGGEQKWVREGAPQIATVPNINRLVTKSIIPQMREEHDPSRF
jgi:hypothetical protein